MSKISAELLTLPRLTRPRKRQTISPKLSEAVGTTRSKWLKRFEPFLRQLKAVWDPYIKTKQTKKLCPTEAHFDLNYCCKKPTWHEAARACLSPQNSDACCLPLHYLTDKISQFRDAQGRHHPADALRKIQKEELWMLLEEEEMFILTTTKTKQKCAMSCRKSNLYHHRRMS